MKFLICLLLLLFFTSISSISLTKKRNPFNRKHNLLRDYEHFEKDYYQPILKYESERKQIDSLFSSLRKEKQKSSIKSYLLLKMKGGDEISCSVYFLLFPHYKYKEIPEKIANNLYEESFLATQSINKSKMCSFLSDIITKSIHLKLPAIKEIVEEKTQINNFKFTQLDWNKLPLLPPEPNTRIILATFDKVKTRQYQMIVLTIGDVELRTQISNQCNCLGYAIGYSDWLELELIGRKEKTNLGLNDVMKTNLLEFGEFLRKYKNANVIQAKIIDEPNSIVQYLLHNKQINLFTISNKEAQNDDEINNKCSSQSEVSVFYFQDDELAHASRRIKFTRFYSSKFGVDEIVLHSFQMRQEDNYGNPSVYWCSQLLN